MIDTHSHIYEPEFDTDREDVIRRAREAGVEQILLPNINAESIVPMLNLCHQHPGYCYPMLGLHPTEVEPANYKQTLSNMQEMLEKPNHPFIAIGEIGLDYYWDKSNEKEQEDAFRNQIEWAIKYQLPLVIHARSAHRRIVDIMAEYRDNLPYGVFHCFGGTEEEASELLQFQGFMLGIGGVLTYKNSNLSKVLTTVPLERIVLETDAPYLSPVPYRGKRNESAYVTEVLQKVADIYNVSKQETESITNNNAKRVFRRMTER
jgi:TatD DNase family protein